jgi:creatinine amidohydrolase
MVAPTFNVGVAQHHMGFPGTITLRPSTMIASLRDWVGSLRHHGFQRFYFLNGHGGNIATIQAAFAEIYGARSVAPGGDNRPSVRCTLRSWWTLPGVRQLSQELFGAKEGSHATPSEVSVTYFAHPDAIKRVSFGPAAPSGPILDAQDFRRRYPDGRMGSDPSLATPEHGERLVDAATREVAEDYNRFLRDAA